MATSLIQSLLTVQSMANAWLCKRLQVLLAGTMTAAQLAGFGHVTPKSLWKAVVSAPYRLA